MLMNQFSARRATLNAIIQLFGTPEQVFPLFEPLGEKLWAEGWDPHVLYPPSGDAELGLVFTTQAHGEPEVVWTITRYDPANYGLSYVTVRPGSRVSKIDVDCTLTDTGATQAQVSYTYTALAPAGNDYIEQQTVERFQAYLSSWEQAINSYLVDGVKAEHT